MLTGPCCDADIAAMPLPDTFYCAQQINTPPELPDILKNFTKAAIRTQPRDLLVWCAAYFNALAKGECLPVKERLEMNVATQKNDTGLTPGLLKTLHKQLSPKHRCSTKDLQTKWKGLCLPADLLQNLLSLGSFGSEIDWMEFFALGCSALGGSSLGCGPNPDIHASDFSIGVPETLISTLKFACEILTDDEEGGPARIPFETYVKLYTYLGRLEGDTQDDIDNFLSSLRPQVDLQHGMIKPLDFIQRDDMDKTGSGSSNFLRATSKPE
ncbi:unnamed protein product [Menidia menidia]|uniref:Ropporin-1-like protein n=1 Tax=Menidia menidia TaxID=238744 RepID=A0A8S4AVN3_9TELE|nr:unnamed protein product [Menidia menidia]